MVQHSDTGGGKMSTSKCYYVHENDFGNILRLSDFDISDLNIGDSYDLILEDFQRYEGGEKYYVLYAFNGGNIYYRGEDNKIICGTMLISESDVFNNWIIVCTDDTNRTAGINYVEQDDCIGEIYLSDYSRQITTKGSDDVISIDITTGATSDSFASYGSTFSPTLSCELFRCAFSDALMSGELYHESVKGSEVFVWYTLNGLDDVPLFMGRFTVRDEPSKTEETISFSGIGMMEAYMAISIVDVKGLGISHRDELEKKYVGSHYMDFVEFGDDRYYWEFLPQDFLNSTGMPIYIEDWDSVVYNMWENHTQQLMIPTIEEFSQIEITDKDGKLIRYDYETNYVSKITWRELLSGIATLLRGNVVEKNGAIYINRMPDAPIDYEVYYQQIFNASNYENSSRFGDKLMRMSDVSARANNWLFYVKKDQKYTYPIGFGYYQGDSTVVINSERNNYNANDYPVTIECPWILFETANRKQTKDMYIWFGHNKDLTWNKFLSPRNNSFVYHQASIQMLGWFPAFSAGNMIVVEDYDGVRKYVYIGEMTLHYSGDVSVEINSPCDVQVDNSASGVSTFSLERRTSNRMLKIENISQCGGYDGSPYSRLSESNRQGMQSKTSSDIRDVENVVEKSLVPSTYSATIPYFEFENFNIEEPMDVTLTEVTE